MDTKQENYYPQIHYFDSDFIKLYEQSWAHIENNWVKEDTSNLSVPTGYMYHEDMEYVDLIDAASSSFFLLYSNDKFSATHLLNFFYSKQEEDGAIRCAYDIKTGEPIKIRGNPEGLAPPLLLWTEHNHYHKTDNKRRVREILPKLDKYLDWICNQFRKTNNLFVVPQAATYMTNMPRKSAQYYIDFHAQMAFAFLFMLKLADTTNQRNLIFKYSKLYYNLKALINKVFWCEKTGFYHDVEANLAHVKEKTIASFWVLLAQIPNNTQSDRLYEHLNNPNSFLTENSFPTLPMDHPAFSEHGNGHRGAVYPLLTYMIVKGLSKYAYHGFARESAIRHLSAILAIFYSEDEELKNTLWETYQPNNDFPAKLANKKSTCRKNYIPSIAMSTITLVIEHIIGFNICLPKKMVFWTIPQLEFMGIESIQLKRNLISTILQNTNRGWEIRHGSEKLYYFNVNILEKNINKTLPIPSGKCSLLVDKI